MVMSEQYHKKEKKLFNTIAWIQSIIIFFSVLILIVFYFVGDFFLEIVFGDTILAYKNLLLPSLMAAGLMATTAFIAAIFTVVDQNILLVFFEGLTFIIDFVLSIILIDRFGLQGINYALIIACVFFIIVGYIWSVIKISQNCRLTI